MKMNATKYIVIGRHDCERNSWIEGGDIRHVVSCHRTLAGAAAAVFPAHRALGGCDGSDLLAAVARRLESAEKVDEDADVYEHAGARYLVLSVWDSHEVAPAYGGLALVPKHAEK